MPKRRYGKDIGQLEVKVENGLDAALLKVNRIGDCIDAQAKTSSRLSDCVEVQAKRLDSCDARLALDRKELEKCLEGIRLGCLEVADLKDKYGPIRIRSASVPEAILQVLNVGISPTEESLRRKRL